MQFLPLNYTLVARICKKFENMSRVGSGVQEESMFITGFKVNKLFWIWVLFVILHLKQQNIIFKHYYQSYSNYLLKLGYMDGKQAVFEELTLSDFKNLSSTTLKTTITSMSTPQQWLTIVQK